jgi:integrase
MGWILSKHEGVRYREHPTRKHGRGKDKYVVIRYRVNGKRVDEVLGWTSQGASLDRANEILCVLRQNHKTGTGPQTMAEMRAMLQKAREAAAADSGLPRTVGDLHAAYIQWAEGNKKSWEDDDRIFWTRIAGLRAVQLADITPAMIEKHRAMLAKEYAPASVKHALGLLRRMMNWAAGHFGEAWRKRYPMNPMAEIKMPKLSNRRLGFLGVDEIHALLAWCSENDPAMHDVIMLGVLTGMRRDEMSYLQVGHVDLSSMIINIVDPKSGELLETVAIPDKLEPMLRARTEDRKRVDFIFPSAKTGLRMTNMSVRFGKAADAVGLNDDLVDERYRVTLHSLRHTFCSHSFRADIDANTIKEMARHKSFDMTLRYSHLSPRARHAAANRLAEFLDSESDLD